MINKDKVILMTKLALYDKHEAEADRTVFSFFRHDYIYRRNMWTRICVLAGCAIILGLYWLNQIFVKGVDIFALDIQKNAVDLILFVLAVMAFYTLVGTIQGTKRYYECQKRTLRYNHLLNQVDRIAEQSKKQQEEDDREEVSNLYYGAAIDRKRKPY